MRKPSKLSEVAKIAGVSPITASRAIRGVGYVSDAARERILQAAAELDYTPDVLARRMRGEKTKLIGVFVNNYGSVVLHEMIRAVGDEARRRGYDWLLFNAERFDSPDRSATCDMLSKLCDGILVLMPSADDGFLTTAEQKKLHCVVVSFEARQLELPVVVPENRNGARLAVEHLIALGHRRIAFIGGNTATGQSVEREKGYLDALRSAGLESEAQLIVNGRFVQPGGFAAVEQLLALAAPPTAIFAANDEMAFGALDALSSKGIKVPAEVSVVGFDDIPTARHVFPTLTTVRQPFEAMAASAVSEVVDLIQGRPLQGTRIAFPMELVIRNSSGSAPMQR